MEITIRAAEASDLLAIYDLVKDLAIYEKAEKEVTATIEDYQQNFAEGVFEALVATKNEGEVIGMTLYYMTYSTWKGRMVYLEDFVVKESYRQYGVGQQLFDALLLKAQEKKARLVKWEVLDWNTPAVRFYEKNKATIEKGWWNCKLFLDS